MQLPTRWRSAILNIILIFMSNIACASFDDAIEAYSNKQFDIALVQFEYLSKIGISGAQFNLGVMYYRGEGVERDMIKGYGWIALAAKTEGPESQWAPLAAKIYNTFNQQYQSQAQLMLADLEKLYSKEAIFKTLEPNFISEAAPDDKVKVLKRVAPLYPWKMRRYGKIGWVDIIYGVARDGSTRNQKVFNSSGKEFDKASLEAVRKWQYKPANSGGRPVEVYGQTMRFTYILEGLTFDEEKVQKMVDERRETAVTGSGLQKFQFAQFLSGLKSFGDFKIETKNHNEWFLDAATEGFSLAEFQLGKNVLSGKFCSADTVKSLAWLQRAANQGLTEAQYILAVEMLSGIRFEKNIDSAISWLTRAAENGDEASKLKLAWIYATSEDQTYFNNKQAVHYLEQVDDDYGDLLSYYEVSAAVHAAQKDFKKASKLQNKAIDLAEEYELSLAYYKKPLNQYENKKEWLEAL